MKEIGPPKKARLVEGLGRLEDATHLPVSEEGLCSIDLLW